MRQCRWAERDCFMDASRLRTDWLCYYHGKIRDRLIVNHAAPKEAGVSMFGGANR